VDTQALAVHHLELAVSLAWWTKAYGHRFDASLVSTVHNLKPAVMLARGLTSVQTLRADPFWRYWQVLEYQTALECGGSFTPEEMSRITEARAHLAHLADRPAA
jgi:hypothetical protein